MNRLWVRLTLAFMVVTLFGVATVALLTDWSAGTEFRQYLARQEALADSGIVDDLQSYYEQNGNWNGVAKVLGGSFIPGGDRGAGAMRGRPGVVLADASSIVVYDERGTRTGSTLTADERASALAIQVSGGRTVGYLLTAGPMAGRGPMQPAEQSFMDDLRRTLLITAVLAGVLGILMGLVISRMVAAPLASLAEGARAFAGRNWTHRVPVKGTDEVNQVAREFNEMARTIQTAETLRRNLMADVAHELRTPLTVLQGNLRAMLDGVYPLEQGEIATLYDETRILNRLVDDLRELALADAGQLPLNVREVDVAAVCHATAATFSAAAQAQRVSVKLNIPASSALSVRADPERVAQVLRNLLANALRHTHAGGSITVSTRGDSERFVRIEIIDTGEGIAAEDLPYVFDRFYRGDKSRSRNPVPSAPVASKGSTGLGLAIAKAWVEAMGGSIGVESEVGSGSRFWFVLPAAEIGETVKR